MQQLEHAQNGVHGRADFVAHVGQKLALGQGGNLGVGFGFLQRVFQRLVGGDVGANADVLLRQAVGAQQRQDGGRHPVVGAVLAAVSDLAIPDLAARHGFPQRFKKCGRVQAGVDEAVVLTDQLGEGVATDFAKTLVGVGDLAVQVGDAHDGVLVQRKLLVGQVVVLGEQALGHHIQRLPQGLNFSRAAGHRQFGAQGLVQLGGKLRGFAQCPHGRAQQHGQQAQRGHNGQHNHQQGLGPDGAGGLVKAVQPVAHPNPAQRAAAGHRVPGGYFSGMTGQKVPLRRAGAGFFGVGDGLDFSRYRHFFDVEARRPAAVLVDYFAQGLARGVGDQDRKNAGHGGRLDGDGFNAGQVIGDHEVGVDRGQVLRQRRHLRRDGGAGQVGLLLGGVGAIAQDGHHQAQGGEHHQLALQAVG